MDLPLPVIQNNLHPAHVASLGFEKRMFLMPIARALVTIRDEMDQVSIYRFDAQEELDRSGTDYFFVASNPPRDLIRGHKFTYPIEVISKNRMLTFKTANAPADASISPEGTVEWDIPQNYTEHEALMVVSITDGTGRELSHTIKLSDGNAPSTSPAQSVAASMPAAVQPGSTSRPPSVTNVAPAAVKPASPPIQKPGNASPAKAAVTNTTPKGEGKNHWYWTGNAPRYVRTEKGGLGAILIDDTMYLVQPDGTLTIKPLKLPTIYLHVGMRADHLIGVAANPTRLEVFDRSGKVQKTVTLENVAPKGLVLHPKKPVSYVTLDHTVGELRGTFVAVDETAGTVESGDEEFSQDIVVDPTGRFLVGTYVLTAHVGDQIVVTQQPSRSVPVPRGGQRRGRMPPSRGVPAPSAPRVGIRQKYANVALMMVYDLETPLKPELHGVAPLNMPVGQMRLSFDGRRLTTLAQDSRLAKYPARNPLDLNEKQVDFDLTPKASQALQSSDIAYHPLLPIAAVAGSGTVSFRDVDDGKPISNREKESVDIPEHANKATRRIMFSGDGKHALVLATGNNTEHSLVRVNVPLTGDDQKAMRDRAASTRKDLKESAPPLTDLTALSGGVPEPSSTSEITTKYADSVVIVRTAHSTGTGFIVGSNGLILTCAHCVSPLESVEVVFHPKGKPDDKETVEATIIRRDRKNDLALLKIDTKKPLHPVVLAEPLDVKSGGEVTIIANPGLGTEVLDNTVTTGVISSGKRTLEGNDYIQSSAGVNPGSSGGPMFDRTGRVIGVVVLKANIEGVGFAADSPSHLRRLLNSCSKQLVVTVREASWSANGSIRRRLPLPSVAWSKLIIPR
jgi:hypothetical protein